MKKLLVPLFLVFLTFGCAKQTTLPPSVTVIVVTATPEPTITPFPTVNAAAQATAMARYAFPTPTIRPGYPTPLSSTIKSYKQSSIDFNGLYIGKYVVRRWRVDSSYDMYTISSIGQDEIQTPTTSILPESGGGLDTLTGSDITGEGDPDFILHVYTGGNHCCHIVQVYNLGKIAEMVFQLNTSASSGTFVDLDSDGIYEYETYDPTFEYVNLATGDLPCSFAVSPSPRSIFRYSQGQGYIAANLQFTDRYQEDIISHTKLIENYLQNPSTAANKSFSICDVSNLVLDYLYSGQPDKAWETLYKIYPIKKANQYKEIIESKLESNLFFDER